MHLVPLMNIPFQTGSATMLKINRTACTPATGTTLQLIQAIPVKAQKISHNSSAPHFNLHWRPPPFPFLLKGELCIKR